jgi:hypothetical protein
MSISVTARTIVSTSGIEKRIAGLLTIPAIIDHYAQLIFDSADPLIPRKTGADAATLEIIRDALSATIRLGAGLPGGYGYLLEVGYHHVGSGTFVQRPALLPAFLMHRDAFIEAVRLAASGR